MCDIDDTERVGFHKEEGPQRISRDESDVKKLIHTITTTMSNPFDLSDATEENPVQLRNIATGTVLPSDCTKELLNLNSRGGKAMREFTEKRLKDSKVSFWAPIPRVNIPTFASLSKKIKVKGTDEKIVTMSADRALFGRLLVAAKYRDIDLKEVLRHELSAVPFSIACSDGSLRKPLKSLLLKELESVTPSVDRIPSSSIPT